MKIPVVKCRWCQSTITKVGYGRDPESEFYYWGTDPAVDPNDGTWCAQSRTGFHVPSKNSIIDGLKILLEATA